MPAPYPKPRKKYTVRQGQDLLTLAKLFKIDPGVLAQANQGVRTIRPGMVLNVPSGEYTPNILINPPTVRQGPAYTRATPTPTYGSMAGKIPGYLSANRSTPLVTPTPTGRPGYGFTNAVTPNASLVDAEAMRNQVYAAGNPATLLRRAINNANAGRPAVMPTTLTVQNVAGYNMEQIMLWYDYNPTYGLYQLKPGMGEVAARGSGGTYASGVPSVNAKGQPAPYNQNLTYDEWQYAVRSYDTAQMRQEQINRAREGKGQGGGGGLGGGEFMGNRRIGGRPGGIGMGFGAARKEFERRWGGASTGAGINTTYGYRNPIGLVTWRGI